MAKFIGGEGIINPEIAIVAEAPGAQEELQGKPFVGRSGELINTIMKEIGLDREKCYITNVIKFRPENNRTPTNEEILYWQSLLWIELYKIKPKIILALGSVAYKALKDDLSVKITQDRGQLLKTTSNLIYIPTFHPSYILRNPNKYGILKSDFERAISYVKSV